MITCTYIVYVQYASNGTNHWEPLVSKAQQSIQPPDVEHHSHIIEGGDAKILPIFRVNSEFIDPNGSSDLRTQEKDSRLAGTNMDHVPNLEYQSVIVDANKVAEIILMGLDPDNDSIKVDIVSNLSHGTLAGFDGLKEVDPSRLLCVIKRRVRNKLYKA